MPQSISDFFSELLTGSEKQRLMREDKNSRMQAAGVETRPTLKAVTWVDKVNDLLGGRAENTIDDGPVATALNMAMGEFDPSSAGGGGGGKAVTVPFGRRVADLDSLSQFVQKTRPGKLKDELEAYQATRRGINLGIAPNLRSGGEIPIARKPESKQLEAYVESLHQRYPELETDYPRVRPVEVPRGMLKGNEAEYKLRPPLVGRTENPNVLVEYPEASRILIGQGERDPVNVYTHELMHAWQDKNKLIGRGKTSWSYDDWQWNPDELTAMGVMMPDEDPATGLMRQVSARMALDEPQREPIEELLTGIAANKRGNGKQTVRTRPREIIKGTDRLKFTHPSYSLQNLLRYDERMPQYNLNLARQGSPFGVQPYYLNNEVGIEPIEWAKMATPYAGLSKADLKQFRSVLAEIAAMTK